MTKQDSRIIVQQAVRIAELEQLLAAEREHHALAARRAADLEELAGEVLGELLEVDWHDRVGEVQLSRWRQTLHGDTSAEDCAPAVLTVPRRNDICTALADVVTTAQLVAASVRASSHPDPDAMRSGFGYIRAQLGRAEQLAGQQ